MKRKIYPVICAALFIFALTACGKTDVQGGPLATSDGETVEADPNALRVLVDFGISESLVYDSHIRDQTLEELKAAIEEAGGPKDISFECVYYPYTSKDAAANYGLRDSELKRVRTEIMAGEGPDVFLVACHNGREAPLFTYPDQVMSRRTFLPLDSYIEKAQFMEWDKLTPIIMEAGKTKEGQQVLPLTYSLPMTVFRAADMDHEHSKTLTFFDIAESDSLISVLSSITDTKMGQFDMDRDRQAAVISKLADYENETLAFTEEDLKSVIRVLGDLENRKDGGEFQDAPDYFYSNLMVGFNSYPISYSDVYAGIGERTQVTLFPFYSIEGGYCAAITSFAAVNRNTKRPDDAFFVLDYLLSLEGQCSPVYINLTTNQSIPTHEEAMQKRTKVTVSGDKGINGWIEWFLPKSNFQELCALRDNISSVRFRTELDGKLVSLLNKSKLLANSEEALDREVHRAYMEMSMLLAES